MKKWYVRGKQKNFGPYSSEQLNTLLDKNKIKLTTLISVDENDWKSVEKCGINKIHNKKSVVKKTQIKTEQSSPFTLQQNTDTAQPTTPPVDRTSPQHVNSANNTHNMSSGNSPKINNNQQEKTETEESKSPVMYNDLYIFALVLLPILVAGGLVLGLPKSILGIIFSVTAFGLVYIDREALKKFDLEPPHWFFALLPPTYLKQREKVQENPHFFTLSSIATLILTATIVMYGTNESSDSSDSDPSYVDNYEIYDISEGLKGSTEDLPLPDDGEVVQRMDYFYSSGGRSYAGYRWYINPKVSFEDIELHYDLMMPDAEKDTFFEETTYIYKETESILIRVVLNNESKYFSIDELHRI